MNRNISCLVIRLDLTSNYSIWINSIVIFMYILAVPYSNYVARNRSTLYKQSLQNDLTFPELFPLTNI